MRSIFLAGGMALACLSLAPAASSAESYADSYYAQQPVAEEDSPGAAEQSSLVAAPEPCGDCGCDCCDCPSYDCCDMFNGRQRVLGLLPSDHCFDDFISPLSNPFYFEDPRSLTEVRGIFLDQSLPNEIDGGDAQVYAAQLRGRVTDRVSIIAPRLADLQVNQAGGDSPDGFMSAPLGFKYNFLRDVERQLLASVGVTYFVKGSGGAVSNWGSGDFHFFLTGGKEIFTYGHWLSATGFRIPADSNWGTQMWYWSNQWDYEIADNIYPLVGVNWFHFMRSADVPSGIPFTGLDLFDLPANGVAGAGVVTGVAGVKWKPSPHCEVGTGFEFPMTGRHDIMNNRLYADLIFRY